MAGLIAVALVISARGNGGTPEGSGATIGGDLHSLVAFADGRVYLGGHAGVAVTRDGGKTWSTVGPLDQADAMGWGVRDQTLFVSGHPGLSRSDDDGVTFRPAGGGLPDSDVHAFGAGADVLYAAGPALGVVASTDGGATWAPRSSGNGRSFFGRMIVDTSNHDHVVAGDARSGAVESTDGGRTWRPLPGGPATVTWLSSPDGAARTILASGGNSAARTTDGGRTWQPLSLPSGASIVEATPSDAQHLYASGLSGSSARLWVSSDGGTSWSPA